MAGLALMEGKFQRPTQRLRPETPAKRHMYAWAGETNVRDRPESGEKQAGDTRPKIDLPIEPRLGDKRLIIFRRDTERRGRRPETGRRYTPRRDTGRQFTGHAAFCGLCGVAALGRLVAVGDPVSRVPCLCVISCAGLRGGHECCEFASRRKCTPLPRGKGAAPRLLLRPTGCTQISAQVPRQVRS